MYRMFCNAYGGNEIFEGAMILRAWRALNSAANVDGVRLYACNGLPDILFV
jgi:hypothetical protein